MSRNNGKNCKTTSKKIKAESGMSHLRILAQGEYCSNDSIQTRLNNNDVIIGPPGAGKTRHYVLPNILQCEGSMIIADTKGDLYNKTAVILEGNGYDVQLIDFTAPKRSTCGYDPLTFVRREEDGTLKEEDVHSLAAALLPMTGAEHDPFWQYSARTLAAALMAYVLEANAPEEQTFDKVLELFRCYNVEGKNPLDNMMKMLSRDDPNSLAVRQYRMIRAGGAFKTEASIKMILGSSLRLMETKSVKNLFELKPMVDFAAMGRKKAILFVNVSDSDRAMDTLVNMFYTQALQQLLYHADHDYEDHRLPVPVRIFLDDFATNVVIPDFDKVISVVRSRGVSVSIILQGITQLESLYGQAAGMTILNCCDHMLYLGGTEIETVRMMAERLDLPMQDVLYAPLERAYLFTRGQRPRCVRKYELSCHPLYDQLKGENKLGNKFKSAVIDNEEMNEKEVI